MNLTHVFLFLLICHLADCSRVAVMSESKVISIDQVLLPSVETVCAVSLLNLICVPDAVKILLHSRHHQIVLLFAVTGASVWPNVSCVLSVWLLNVCNLGTGVLRKVQSSFLPFYFTLAGCKMLQRVSLSLAYERIFFFLFFHSPHTCTDTKVARIVNES